MPLDNGFSTGGISYYYLLLLNETRTEFNTITTNSDMIEILTAMHCNFTMLGGTLGAAFHIRKTSIDRTSLLIKIEDCNFMKNEANVGSAVYGTDHRFIPTLSDGLIINLTNVNAENNALSQGTEVKYFSRAFITGIFHNEICHFVFNCNLHCNFLNNQPSVLYGRSSFFTLSGNVMFANNTARYGGGLRLLNTVVYIHQNSKLQFHNNHAIINGGAIDAFFYNTYKQSQDICPIQFIGSSDQIFLLEDISQTINITVIFQNNTIVSRELGASAKLESIYANVFYLCTWYSYTLTQVYLAENIPENGTRPSVYHEIFTFIPDNKAAHLSISAYIPCPCDENYCYDAQSCLNNALKFNTTVIIGRPFTIRLITLDVVGSIGHSLRLYSDVFSLNTTDNILRLHDEQIDRPFSLSNGNCTAIDFTVYMQAKTSLTGITPQNLEGELSISLSQNAYRNLHLNFKKCPIGFSLQDVSISGHELLACACGEFFNKPTIKEDFKCDSASGKITRIDIKSWLSVMNDTVEYVRFCSPGYCNNIVGEFSPTHDNTLCAHNHKGRACGACANDYGKSFGSNFCHKCKNLTLFTILLYATLGIIMVSIIYSLKLTVTMGTINGLIFFCNVMSINESLLFNPSKFSFIKIFVSLINLDLGFKLCFYKEMSEIAKTGFQFVFPLYLWLLMFIIIMVGKHYMRSGISTNSAVPVLATLILLSYSKILRATISVFFFVTVHYSTNDFSDLDHFVAWQPDPNVKYLEGSHIVLFIVALIFKVLFILPLAFALTFPKVVLRSKKLSYFFPLLDCIYAPYKDHCRFWFGVRLIVLIYFSEMESALISYQDSLLLSGVVVILLFALIQACISPFKSTIINTLDLMFMGLFIALSIVVLYLYPNTSGNEQYVAINVLGGMAFLLFCFIIIFHLHDALKYFTFYSHFTETLKTKRKLKGSWNQFLSVNAEYFSHNSDQSLHQNTDERSSNYAYLQETLLEEQFN